MRKVILALATATAFFGTPASASTILFSENFESGTFGAFGASGQVGVNTGQDYVTCCGATGSPASLANHFASFGSGDQASGTLTSPTFSLLAGETYTLSFEIGAWGQGTETIFLNILEGGFLHPLIFPRTGTTNLDSVFTAPPPFVITPESNETFSFSFTSSGGLGIDAFLDNVSFVTTADLPRAPSLPEPRTWLMMLLGFAGVGSVMRRQVKHQFA